MGKKFFLEQIHLKTEEIEKIIQKNGVSTIIIYGSPSLG